MKEKTKNFLSEDQVLEVIKQYAESEIDYAFMLNGPWGSGKTYFIENRLKQELTNPKEVKGNKISYLYLSLYGIKNVEQFRNELYSCIIKHFSNTLQKTSNIARLLLDITAGSNEHTSIITQSANKLIISQERRVINNNLSSDLFLVVDDFERYEGNEYNELLGFITSKCLNNHVHVLFVCNEDNLLSFGQKEELKNYFMIKEKSIRHTINYHTEIHRILLSILNNKNRYPYLSKYKEQHTAELSKLFRTLEDERNIRTWYVAFDCFEKYAKDYGEEIQEHPKYLESILRDFLISASVYNKFPTYFEKTNANTFSEEEMQKKEQRIKDITEYVSDTFHFHYASNPFELIYDRAFYLEHPTKDFFKCAAIFEYFQSGYLDFHMVKQHFDKIYPIASKYEKAYINLQRYKEISEECMRTSFSDFREGLLHNAYDLWRILNIIVLETVWKQDLYLKLFHQEDLTERILEYCKKYDFSNEKYGNLINLENELYRISSSPIYEPIKEIIQNQRIEEEKGISSISLDSIIMNAKNGIYEESPFSTVEHIVNSVVYLGSYERIANLDSDVLSQLAYYFNETYDRSFSFKFPIDIFYENLSKFIKTEPKTKHDLDFILFLRSVKKCIKHKDS